MAQSVEAAAAVAEATTGEDENKKAASPIAVPTGTAIDVVDFGDFGGAGFEDVQRDELKTPFLRMLQGLSPELNPGNESDYIEGASMGMICNTSTKEVYPGKVGVDLIVFARTYHYGLWIPRDKGGGFRGMKDSKDPEIRRLVTKYGKFKNLPTATEDGEEVDAVETGQLYVLYAKAGELTAENCSPAIVSFTKTSFPIYSEYVSKHNQWLWNTPKGRSTASIWAYPWNLSARSQKNAKGDYFVWSMKLAPPAQRYQEALIRPDNPLYEKGQEWFLMYRSGIVKPDYEKPQEDDVPF